MKKKILVTTATRAEYGTLRPIMEKIRDSDKLELILLVTGTHLSKSHGFTINEILQDKFKIHAKFNYLPIRDDNFSMSTALGKGIINFSKIFQKFHPDINLLIGDRDEMLASAIAASHMNIVNAHIAGGDVSGGIDEYNRHAITKLSNIHFASTKKSKQHIIKMGENKKYVFYTGSPNIDQIKEGRITSKKVLETKYSLKLTGKEIILLQHPVTTESNKSQEQILTTLKAISKLKNFVIGIYPNSDAGNKSILKPLKRFSKTHSNFKLFSTFPREDYLGLLQYAGVLLGNSSSGIIEASYFGIPVVNIGKRQRCRERGKHIYDVSEHSSNEIYRNLLKALNAKQKTKNKSIYGHGNASKKIVKILESMKITDSLIDKKLQF